MREYLCIFAAKLENFHIQELHALCAMHGEPFDADTEGYDGFDSPYLVARFASDEAAQRVARQSVLLRGVFDVWGSGKTYEEVAEAIRAMPAGRMEEFMVGDYGFKFVVDAFGKKIPFAKQVERMNYFSFMDILQKGRVDLKNPTHIFWILEELGRSLDPDTPPRRILFARQVATGSRHLVDKFAVKKRPYMGTTSMEATLALLVATMVHARPHTLVLDPFVGTGSLAITCAHFGSHVLGADLDARVIKGNKKPGVNIMSNFKKYGLEDKCLGFVVNDQSKTQVWARGCVLDAVVADPPYGVREGARKIGMKARQKQRNHRVAEHHKADHVPQCVPYAVEEVLYDLLAFAAKMLVLGGRMAYWLPTTVDYQECDVPQHPCLELFGNSEQVMAGRMRRRLITMVKTVEYDAAVHEGIDLDEYNREFYGVDELPEKGHTNFASKVFLDDTRLDDREKKK
eukprot:CAMPEP_0114607712 /NCGR_PEP_ID=MMETSP0168-20121206/2206_1 /TAXON_ID=95228 ORGANISM="Vannella sp., Strain DIVA3 517/6/12" /NCGR_SAMPLE_ID=MMETSP0168 /ASSEMBLY_ACC=CAM_ASM_000044 /LENGTH=456 /DNA_ID=CAMNT_0001818591 /DNA_START=39 /DNA_END=1406 /DNA_ORIENTATION=-